MKKTKEGAVESNKLKVCIMKGGCNGHMDQFQRLKANFKDTYESTAYSNLADVIIYFVCFFTTNQEKDFYYNMFLIEATKKPRATVILCGCGVGAIKPEVIAAYDCIDYVIRDLNFYEEIAKIMGIKTSKQYYMEDFQGFVYIDVEEGCDKRRKKGKQCKFCNFCKQNYLKVRVKSKYTIEEVCEIVKIHKLPTVILGGLNTTNYGEDFGDGNPKLHLLIKAISEFTFVKWIAVRSVASSGMYPELEEELVNNPKIVSVNYFIQSGSNHMLELMNVGASVEDNSRIIKRLKEKHKAIKGGVIVGYPGETYRDVRQMIEFITDHDLWDSTIFSYINSRGTPAHKEKQLLPKMYEAHCKAVFDAVYKLREKRLQEIAANGMEGWVESIEFEEEEGYHIRVIPFDFDGAWYVIQEELQNVKFGDVVRVIDGQILKLDDCSLIGGKIVEVL